MEIHPLDLSPAGIEAIHRLLKVVWPTAHHLDTRYLNWLYVDNPLGHAFGFNAFEQGDLIGHYAAIPVSACIGGREEQGILSLNTAVHPSARGKGLFKILANQTYELAAQQGIGFVVGVSNQNSTVLFQRQLKFQLVTPLDARIGIGRGVERENREEVPSFRRSWDRQLLAWRLARPGNPYRVRIKENRGIIYSPTGKPSLYAEMGSFPVEDLPSSLSPLCCVNPVRLWIGLDPDRLWHRTLTMPLPERFRTSPLNLIFKDLTGQNREMSKDKLKFSLLDFDAW